MKYVFLFCFALNIIGGSSQLHCSAQSMNFTPGAGGMLPMPTEEEMREIEQFLATLSPEDLKVLEEMGQKIIDEANEKNVPVFGPAPGGASQPVATPKTEKPKESVSTPTPTPIKKNSATKDVVNKTRDLLQNLIETINAIRQKIAEENVLEDIFAKINLPLNTLLYYLHVVDDDKVAGSLKDTEFTSLYELLKRLDADLTLSNNNFYVPEAEFLNKITPAKEKQYKQEMAAAENMTRVIFARFNQALDKDLLNEELEKLIRKYEPEALKLKQ